MKFYRYCALTLLFFNLGVLSVLSHETDPHAYTSETFWQNSLATFEKHIKIDSVAARAELQHVAETVFKGHVFTEEWVPLYFRIHRDGTASPSDLKRIHELAHRMLTDVDPEKYAKQIQHHQKGLEYYGLLDVPIDTEDVGRKTAAGEQSTLVEKASGPDIAEKQQIRNAYQHYQDFFSHLKNARSELDAFAALTFQGHPQTQAWKSLFFRFAVEKQGSVSEAIEFHELKSQMLMDIDPKKHAEEIRALEDAVKRLKSFSEIFKKQGTLATEKIGIDLAPKD